MSATAVRSEYAALLTSTLPSVIRSEAENDRYIASLEELERKGTRMTAAERRMAELLAFIEDFEEKHYSLKAACPVEVLNERMLANSLKQKDLLDVFGTPSILSEVLRGKRKLTTEHIRRLSRRFRLSRSVFLTPLHAVGFSRGGSTARNSFAKRWPYFSNNAGTRSGFVDRKINPAW
jgi:HTH-type transcriptional regulator/antitoxin HigA